MKIIYSDECKEFDNGEYEKPERVARTFQFLKNNYEFVKPVIASEKDILRVHSKEFINSIKTLGKENSEFFDEDLFKYNNILHYARLSAGGAILASDLCFKENVFSLMRPPGHHAGKKAEGFCFFNNIAIACSYLIANKKAKKIAIIDIDLHHGNGTQDIFLGNDKILFISIHMSPEYPHTGLKNEKNCINFPLAPGTNEKEYLTILNKAIDNIKEFNPDVIGVSAGFDTYKEDIIGNIGSFNLEIESYEKIARAIKNIGKPVFSILEGGYSDKLHLLIESYLKGFE